jgi:hypothetical protein|tara:strand:+ start:215 stop:382 length:168 start_codon:yes stop_codon:yes gene_type:complete
VRYGQIISCYFTTPTTSTQGITKEGDKDYIARVAHSVIMDFELYKKGFSGFVELI